MAGHGKVSTLIARSGLQLGAFIGAVAFMLLAVIGGIGDDDPDRGVAATIAGFAIVLVPIGVVLGLVFGLLARSAARSWSSTWRPSAVDVRDRAHWPDHSHRPDHSRSADGGGAPEGIGAGLWADRYGRCAQSVRQFDAIVAACADSPGRDWLLGIAGDLSAELAEALRLARYGHALAPGGEWPAGSTPDRIAERLGHAEAAFAAMAGRAGAIAMDLGVDSDFGRIRTQLAVLAQQAPNLRALPEV